MDILTAFEENFERLRTEIWFLATLAVVFILAQFWAAVSLGGFIFRNLSANIALQALRGIGNLIAMLLVFGLTFGLLALVISLISRQNWSFSMPNVLWRLLSIVVASLSCALVIPLLVVVVCVGIAGGLFFGTTTVTALASTLFVAGVITTINALPEIESETRRLSGN